MKIHFMKRRNIRWVSSVFAASFALSFAALGEGDVSKLPAPSEKTGVTYATDIKPLLDRSCIKCHGEEKQKAKLRLDSLEHVLKGSRDEPILVKGKSAKSKVVFAVAKATEDEDYWMPPEDKAQPFSKEEIALLRAWIDQGAK